MVIINYQVIGRNYPLIGRNCPLIGRNCPPKNLEIFQMKKITFVTLLLASLSLWLVLGCGGSQSQTGVQTANTTRVEIAAEAVEPAGPYADPVPVSNPVPAPVPVSTTGNHDYTPQPAPTIKPLQPKPGLNLGTTYPYNPTDPYKDRSKRDDTFNDLIDDLTLQNPIYIFQPGDGSRSPAWPAVRIAGNDENTGLLHILIEHHPHYWIGGGSNGDIVDKQPNGFFDPSMTPEDILAYIKEYIRKYKERNGNNSIKPPYGAYPPIKIGGAFYVLVIGSNGEIITFYPVKTPPS
jgi:hypothetical protein